MRVVLPILTCVLACGSQLLARAPEHTSVEEASGEDPAVCLPGEMVRVPAGTLRVDGRPPVSIASFEVDCVEVSVGRYAECVRDGHCDAPTVDDFCNGDGTNAAMLDQPVNCVTWESARKYCEWVGKRLLSSDEWEFAAGGGVRRFPWGDADPTPGIACWRVQRTAPVGTHPLDRTPEGVFDMAGNVSEWVSDYFDSSLPLRQSTPLPQVPDRSARVVRGGWYSASESELLAVYGIDFFDPAAYSPIIGFRCARSRP